MATAIIPSVTVSMADESNGTGMETSRVSRVERTTS